MLCIKRSHVLDALILKHKFSINLRIIFTLSLLYLSIDLPILSLIIKIVIKIVICFNV